MINFSKIKKQAKIKLLKMHYEASIGHIGGNLSCLDILLNLFHFNLTQKDKFILSKGHGAGALYIALNSIGKISDQELKTFHQNNTKLAGHPAPNWIEEIPFATGSLGHGFGLACGLALSSKINNQSQEIYCLTSDGEWQEGSNWESLIFTNHHKLSNLTIIVDCNDLQGFGTTKEISSLDQNQLNKLFQNLNYEIINIDGHNDQEIQKAIKIKTNKPKIILAKTIKGKGVSFMENEMKWHYLPMEQEDYQEAIRQINEA